MQQQRQMTKQEKSKKQKHLKSTQKRMGQRDRGTQEQSRKGELAKRKGMTGTNIPRG